MRFDGTSNSLVWHVHSGEAWTAADRGSQLREKERDLGLVRERERRGSMVREGDRSWAGDGKCKPSTELFAINHYENGKLRAHFGVRMKGRGVSPPLIF